MSVWLLAATTLAVGVPPFRTVISGGLLAPESASAMVSWP